MEMFRRQFQEMCASIGVDPLSSHKGFWSVLNLGDFYYELGVQIVEVCLATSHINGGLISLEEIRDRLCTLCNILKGGNLNVHKMSVDMNELWIAAV